MAAAMPTAMPTYAPVVRLLLGGELDAAVGEELLSTEGNVLLVVVVLVAVVLLELDGMILV
jgi:hypothetical protein